MKASDIRAKYLKFFESRGHAIIPAAPIIPPDDPTTLFTSSGMQQMVPYLKGAKHSMGVRIVDSQPSFRSDDIEEVGDNRHICMFEMLGNWSLGDYFKKEQLAWVYEFLTKELSLPADRLHVTLFEGDAFAQKDIESFDIWRSIGVAVDHIHYYPAKKNWWSRAGTPEQMPVGEIGGPDSEVFYDFGADLKLHEKSAWKNESCHVNCDCGRYLEIGNSVFMQFVKTDKGLDPLPAKNVDFGGGLERLAMVSQNTTDIFKIDMFAPIIQTIEEFTNKKYQDENLAPMRVIADHLRAATFMIAQGLEPSNKLQGYILRRLLRRAAVRSNMLAAGLTPIPAFEAICNTVIKEYVNAGFIESESVARNNVSKIIDQEMTKFGRALDRGLKAFTKAPPITYDSKEITYDEVYKTSEKKKYLSAALAFDIFESYGLPLEIIVDIAKSQNIYIPETIDELFEKEIIQHQTVSRTASAGMFKGGLADQSEITTKYHTATHLLHQALHDVLGEEIQQAGSNITSERLRFDYTYSGKPTPDQLKQIAEIVNKKIVEDLAVVKTIEDKTAALKSGARAFFAEKYPDKVSVYTIGNYSKELCGGPHVEHTGIIGPIEIYKDEALGSGKRRIYAKLV